jgi:hypothetical protein
MIYKIHDHDRSKHNGGNGQNNGGDPDHITGAGCVNSFAKFNKHFLFLLFFLKNKHCKRDNKQDPAAYKRPAEYLQKIPDHFLSPLFRWFIWFTITIIIDLS